MSNFLSFFTRQDPQLSSISSNPPPSAAPTQIFVTLDTTTHVDPAPKKRFSLGSNKFKRSSRSSPRVSRTSVKPPPLPDTPGAPKADHTTFSLPFGADGKHQPAFPTTPGSTPTTFVLTPRRDSLQPPQGYTDYDSDSGESGPNIQARQHLDLQPKTLSRKFFLYGFLCPVFWLIGFAIMLRPPRAAPQWEQGHAPGKVAWETAALRETERKWARRCLIALVVETILIVLVVIIIKWGLKKL